MWSFADLVGRLRADMISHLRRKAPLLTSLSQYAQDHGLPRVGGRPRFPSYIRDVWVRREFIVTMARYRLRSGFEENRLGIGWVVLRPLLNAVIYGTIFGLLQAGNRPPDFAAYVVIGVFLFEFFQGCFNDGSKAIVQNRSLVQSLAFPRITLPISFTVERFISFGVMLVVLIPILAFFGHFPQLDWLMLVPILIGFTIFNAGVSFITARLTVHVADLSQLLPFVSRILFYTSGVLFDVERILENHPWVLAIYDFHPLYQVLTMARHYLIDGSAFPGHYWISLFGIALVMFVGGALFFWSAEERYGRE